MVKVSCTANMRLTPNLADLATQKTIEMHTDLSAFSPLREDCTLYVEFLSAADSIHTKNF